MTAAPHLPLPASADPERGLAAAPAATPAAGVGPDTLLYMPLHPRLVVHRATAADGTPSLHLLHGGFDIEFDRMETFAFAEGLARHAAFRAGDAAHWAPALGWHGAAPLLAELLEAGLLRRTGSPAAARVPEDDPAGQPDAHLGGHIAGHQGDPLEDPLDAAPPGDRPSPLPPAPATRARGWHECPAITADLAGRPVPLGYLETIVPIFRIAHPALDAEGRQVGEANVFPPGLRIDAPTRWRTCPFPGTRHRSDRPMNVTALRSIRAQWPVILDALRRIRAAYLRRFPDAAAQWTVGHLERMTTLALAVPAYALMKADDPVAQGALHPALASLFRVTDGVRMTMHQMLFIPTGEAALAPDTPVTAGTIHAWAERNYSFHSGHGVCAGPRAMVDELLAVLVDGAGAGGTPPARAPAVEAALADLDAAFDYAMRGLRLYACAFSTWPAMTRAWEQVWQALDTTAADRVPALRALRERVRADIERLRGESYLAHEAWRVDRERVYADMYRRCAGGLREPDAGADLARALRAPDPRAIAIVAGTLQRRLAALPREAGPGEPSGAAIAAIAAAVAAFIGHLQAVVAASAVEQQAINALLGRTPPERPLEGDDIDVHNRLQGSTSRRLPWLPDAIGALLDLRIGITAGHVVLTTAPRRAAA